MEEPVLPVGFPTHTLDIHGRRICLGDTVDYDYPEDDPCPFVVVFEDNAFRKKYKRWDKTSSLTVLRHLLRKILPATLPNNCA